MCGRTINCIVVLLGLWLIYKKVLKLLFCILVPICMFFLSNIYMSSCFLLSPKKFFLLRCALFRTAQSDPKHTQNLKPGLHFYFQYWFWKFLSVSATIYTKYWRLLKSRLNEYQISLCTSIHSYTHVVCTYGHSNAFHWLLSQNQNTLLKYLSIEVKNTEVQTFTLQNGPAVASNHSSQQQHFHIT